MLHLLNPSNSLKNHWQQQYWNKNKNFATKDDFGTSKINPRILKIENPNPQVEPSLML